MGSLGAVHGEEAAHFLEDAVERTGLEAAFGLDDVAVHRITRPDHRMALALHRADQRGKAGFDLFIAEAADQGDAPRLAPRVEQVELAQQFIRAHARTALHAQRIADPAQELDMGRSFKAGAVADPQHVGRRIVPVPGQRIAAGHRLLVGQVQRLVAGIEACSLKLRHGLRVDPAGLHEVQRLANPVRHFGEAVGPRAAPHEIQRPLVDLAQVGIAAGREGAQQVERRRGLRIGLEQALRIGDARFSGEIDPVDVVAQIAWQFDAILHFDRRRARLGKLSGHAAHLHHRLLAGKGQHHRHLQQHAEGVADVVGVKFGKAFGAVPALEQETLARRHFGQVRLQRARLAREDQRGKVRKRPGYLVQRLGVGIGRQMPRFLGLPAIGGPRACHFTNAPDAKRAP